MQENLNLKLKVMHADDSAITTFFLSGPSEFFAAQMFMLSSEGLFSVRRISIIKEPDVLTRSAKDAEYSSDIQFWGAGYPITHF